MRFKQLASCLLLKLLLLTVLAIAAFFCAMLPLSSFNLSHVSSSGSPEQDAEQEIDWAINFIHKRVPVRLVQPESLNRQLDFFYKWALAEIEARFGIVAILWSGGVILIVLLQKRSQFLAS